MTQKLQKAIDFLLKTANPSIKLHVKKEILSSITAEEEVALYEYVAPDESSNTGLVAELGIKNIIWNDHTNIDTTATEVAEYFGFTK